MEARTNIPTTHRATSSDIQMAHPSIPCSRCAVYIVTDKKQSQIASSYCHFLNCCQANVSLSINGLYRFGCINSNGARLQTIDLLLDCWNERADARAKSTV